MEGLPSQQARPKSVTVRRGVLLLGHRVQAYDQNPFILSGQNGDEIPSTKLWISDIPLSGASEDIESAPSRLGVVLRSKLIQDLKNKKQKKTEMESSIGVKIGGFSARLYHKEQQDGETAGSVFALSPAGSHRAPEQCGVQGVVRAVKRGDPTCSGERAVNNQPIWGQSGRAAGEWSRTIPQSGTSPPMLQTPGSPSVGAPWTQRERRPGVRKCHPKF